MKTGDLRRALRSSSHLDDAKTRRVRADDRVGREQLVEFPEERLLEIHVLDDRFDYDIAVRKLPDVGRRRDAPQRCLSVGAGQRSLLDELVERFLDAGQATVERR